MAKKYEIKPNPPIKSREINYFQQTQRTQQGCGGHDKCARHVANSNDGRLLGVALTEGVDE